MIIFNELLGIKLQNYKSIEVKNSVSIFKDPVSFEVQGASPEILFRNGRSFVYLADNFFLTEEISRISYKGKVNGLQFMLLDIKIVLIPGMFST